MQSPDDISLTGRFAPVKRLDLACEKCSIQAMEQTSPSAMHDIGGIARFMCEPVDTTPHELTDFDRTVDAIRQILGRKQVMSVDELRRGIESLSESDYHGLTYYERWLRSIVAILIEKSVITEAELRAAMP